VNRVKIVIGSNYDLEFLNEAINDNNLIVYAFEPNLYIFELCIKNKNIPKNYKLIQKAVSDKVGKSEFNISSDTLSLLSSLKKFKTANNSIFNETIFVDTITMEEFIEQENIKNIEYLHIDSQGSDYDILKSFGNKIKIVEAGVCESMAPNLNWSLYENQHTFEDFKNFFLSNGFDISYEPNSKGMIGSYEVNIYFKKSLIPIDHIHQR
jgi:FkbM family methyltransferase